MPGADSDLAAHVRLACANALQAAAEAMALRSAPAMGAFVAQCAEIERMASSNSTALRLVGPMRLLLKDLASLGNAAAAQSSGIGAEHGA